MEISLPAVIVVFLLCILGVLLFLVSWSRGQARHDTQINDESDAIMQLDSQEDSWEGSFSDAENPLSVTATLDIVYRDGGGFQSKRTIKVRAIDNELHGGLLIAYCSMRQALRTFRFSRVQSCTNTDTGEVVRDIAQHLNSLYEKDQNKSPSNT